MTFTETMKHIHFLLLLAVALLQSCGYKPNEEPQYWSKISHFQESDQPDSLLTAIDDYLDNCPNGAHFNQVQSLKHRLLKEYDEWTNILTNNPTREQMENYITSHQDGFYRTTAIIQLDHIDYSMAVVENTPSAFDEYLLRHPEGNHVSDANRRLAEFEETFTRLDDTEVCAAEQLLLKHFVLLQSDNLDIEKTIAFKLSYFGKDNATREDVIAYMKHTHADNKPKRFSPSEFKVRKIESSGVPVLSVNFDLQEIIYPEDSDRIQTRNFDGTAIISTDSLLITSLKLVKK